jgi:indolepyruvate ferredoxin oxidoreductase beta subunit
VLYKSLWSIPCCQFFVSTNGFAAKFIGFDKEVWLKTVESTVPPKTIEINKAAFESGYNAIN